MLNNKSGISVTPCRIEGGDTTINQNTKRSAAFIGAQSLLALCTRMEQVASSGDAAELPMLLGQFGQEAQRVMDALVALDAAECEISYAKLPSTAR